MNWYKERTNMWMVNVCPTLCIFHPDNHWAGFDYNCYVLYDIRAHSNFAVFNFLSSVIECCVLTNLWDEDNTSANT
jgi:hypothetical protein